MTGVQACALPIFEGAIALAQERLKRLDEVAEATRLFFEEVGEYDPAGLIPKKGNPVETLGVLKATLEALQILDDWSLEAIEARLRTLAEELGVKAGAVLWPLRFAVTGKEASPGAFECVHVLGKQRVLTRIEKAITKLEAG